MLQRIFQQLEMSNLLIPMIFGTSKTNFWKPFPYEKRVSDAEKAVRKYEELEKLNLAQSTKRSKLTSFISNELKSRQLKFPLIGKFIDMAKAEPLHLKNNTVKERFMCLFRICVSVKVTKCQMLQRNFSRMFVLQICELHQDNHEL